MRDDTTEEFSVTFSVNILKVKNGWIVSIPGTTNTHVFNKWADLNAYLQNIIGLRYA